MKGGQPTAALAMAAVGICLFVPREFGCSSTTANAPATLHTRGRPKLGMVAREGTLLPWH